jgi:RHS repeat-associated protein
MAPFLRTTLTRYSILLRLALTSLSLAFLLLILSSSNLPNAAALPLNVLAGLAFAVLIHGLWQIRQQVDHWVSRIGTVGLTLAVVLAPIDKALAAPPAPSVIAVAAQAAPTPAGVYYPLLDHQGSVRALTDSGGIVKLRQSYDPWGNVRARSGPANLTTLGWAGERVGTADGLVWLRARHYAPALGRFLQRDTFAGDPTNGQSLNRYAGLENNPVNLSDPSGHCASGAVVDTLVCLTVAEKVVLTLVAGGAAYHAYISHQNAPKGNRMNAYQLRAIADASTRLADSLRGAGVRVSVGSNARGQVLTINKGDFERLAAKFGKVRFGNQTGSSGGGRGPNGKPPWWKTTAQIIITLSGWYAALLHPYIFPSEQEKFEKAGKIGPNSPQAMQGFNTQQQIRDAGEVLRTLEANPYVKGMLPEFQREVDKQRNIGFNNGQIANRIRQQRPKLWQDAQFYAIEYNRAYPYGGGPDRNDK